ncbi:MAG: D-alanyl-D-alanine carboxypeptidase/D-alanyl-D-alanine-endopeptidase [Bacteroidetes bacterium]|nr:D-alanyl-D-alanine carboxypeptidase/D-alanyl-D-alanine-endopeptidase [Bacteroidota bacterium]
MLRSLFLLVFCFTGHIVFPQPVADRVKNAFREFEKDEQVKYAISSLYVLDAKTGEVVFDKNSRVGLAPASTQKIITSVSAFEMLGKDYRYKTVFYLAAGNNVFMTGSGDPTLGSSRYKSAEPDFVFGKVLSALKQKGRKSISDFFIVEQEKDKNIPSGWIYEDMGNYYGAAPKIINWKENQYDIFFKPGQQEGDPVKIDTAKTRGWYKLINNCKTGKPGSGDNAYVYYLPENKHAVIEGTVPAGEKSFNIAAADAQPDVNLSIDFKEYIKRVGFYTGDVTSYRSGGKDFYLFERSPDTLYIHFSPALDSIIYWFNRKSINLYGEALLRTLSAEKNKKGTTEDGIQLIKQFWKNKGLDEDELNINDGSGLSPINRVTTHAQVEILKYARKQNWFERFYESLPEYNGMKMKSGTISDVKGYCGYHTSKDGRTYIFSFLVNNYNGRTAGVVSKMFRVLDELK